MAMNKQQALAYKRKRQTSYGAEPGEVTQGLKPGDRVYDADTNTWQLKQQSGIPAYIDAVLEKSGMTDVQGSSSGNSGTGSSDRGKGDQPEASDADSQEVQDAIDRGISLEQLAAGGIIGAGATLIAQKLLRKKGGYKPGPETPAGDTAGEADKGGQAAAVGTDVTPRKPPIMDAEVSEIYDALGLPPPQRKLPAPDVGDVAPDPAMAGSAELSQPQQALPAPPYSDIDASILRAEDGSQPLPNSDLERALQEYVQRLAAGGDPEFDLNNALNPSLNPDLPMMDQAVMARLKALIAGMM